MISKLSKLIALFLHKEHIIDDERIPVCEYGIELMISTMIGFLLVIMVGVMMNALAHALFFYLVFIGVRLYTGGYHADSHFKCKLTLVLCCVFVLSSSCQYEALKDSKLYFLFLAIYLVSVILFSPVEHINAPLTEQEKKRNRGVSIIMAIVLVVVNVLSYIVVPSISAVLTMSLFVIAMLMMIAKIKERGQSYEKGNKRAS